MATKKNVKQPERSFEDSMKRLDEIASILEEGNSSLEESLSLFEEGVGLVKHCNKVLNNAQAKIKILTSEEE